MSFARFAPGPRDPSWLPHVRLVGVNVNGDREFGLALLRFLGEELRRRADAAKRHEVTKLAELRAEDPDGHWPRIVAVIDEFQVLLAGRDAVADEAATLLEDLARRGRSQGIHLVLASPGRLRHRGAVGPAGADRAVHPADRAAQGAPDPGRRQPRRRRRCPGTTRWSTPTPGRRAPTGSSGCPAASDRDDLERAAAQALARPPRPAGADRGCSTATRCRRLPAAYRPAGAGSPDRALDADRPRRRRAGARRADRRAGAARPGCGSAGRPGATSPCSAPAPTRPARARRGRAVAGRQLTPGAGPLQRRLPRRRRGRRRRPAASPSCPEADWYDRTPSRPAAETAAALATPDRPHYVLLYAVDAAADRSPPRPRGTGLHAPAPHPARRPEQRTHVLGWWRGGGPAARRPRRRRLPGSTRSAPGWRSTCTAPTGPAVPAARRPGLVSARRGGRCSSTGRCTAPPRSSSRTG